MSVDDPQAAASQGQALAVSPWILAGLAAYHVAANVVTHFHKAAGAGVFMLGIAIFGRTLLSLLDRYLVQTWRAIDDEATAERAAEPAAETFDYRPLLVLTTSAVVLTLIEYFGARYVYMGWIRERVAGLRHHRYYLLSTYAYWSGFRCCAYIAIPWLVLRLLRGLRLRDCGLSTRGVVKHLHVYGLLYLIILPPLVMASFTAPFQRTYPFYKLASRSWSDFLLWEALYGVQFVALEIFFRGFMLHPLKRSLGTHAIFAAALPYCMFHYNKPIAEVLGAAVAGIVLGTLSLRTRSIWCGAMIHISVAVTMDSLSLFHKAGYPGNPRYIG